MRRYAGAGLIVVGVLLTMYGFESSVSFQMRMARLFHTWPMEGPALLLIGGTICVFIGLGMVGRRRRSDRK